MGLNGREGFEVVWGEKRAFLDGIWTVWRCFGWFWWMEGIKRARRWVFSGDFGVPSGFTD